MFLRPLLTILVTLHATPALASCVDAIRWLGEDALVEEVRGRLASGPLAEAPAEACDRFAIDLAQEDDEVSFSLLVGAERTSHRVASPGAAAAWIESWIVPGLPVDTVAEAEVAEAEPEPPAPAPTTVDVMPVVASPAAPVPEDLGPGTGQVHFGLVGSLDFDRLGQIWYGGGIVLRARLGRAGWIGTTADAVVAVEVDRTERRQLRLSVQGGWARAYRQGRQLWLGLGLGVASARSKLERADETEVFDGDSGPYALVVLAYDRALNERWLFMVSGTVRGYISDDFASAPDPLDPDDVPALPSASFTLRLGFGWHVGPHR